MSTCSTVGKTSVVITSISAIIPVFSVCVLILCLTTTKTTGFAAGRKLTKEEIQKNQIQAASLSSGLMVFFISLITLYNYFGKICDYNKYLAWILIALITVANIYNLSLSIPYRGKKP